MLSTAIFNVTQIQSGEIVPGQEIQTELTEEKVKEIQEDLNVILRKQLDIIQQNDFEIESIRLNNLNEHLLNYASWSLGAYPNTITIKCVNPIVIKFKTSQQEEGLLSTFYFVNPEDSVIFKSNYSEDSDYLSFNGFLICFDARGMHNSLTPERKEVLFKIFRDHMSQAELGELPDIFTKYMDINGLYGFESNIHNSKVQYPEISTVSFHKDEITINFSFLKTHARIYQISYSEITQKQLEDIKHFKALKEITIPSLRGCFYEWMNEPTYTEELRLNQSEIAYAHGAFFVVDKMFFKLELPSTSEKLTDQEEKDWLADISMLMNYIIPHIDTTQNYSVCSGDR